MEDTKYNVNRYGEHEYEYRSPYGEHRVVFRKGRYANNGTLAICAFNRNEDGFYEPYANVTVNLYDAGGTDTCQFVDTNNLDGIDEWLEEQGIGRVIGQAESGYCTYPLFEFDGDFLSHLHPIE